MPVALVVAVTIAALTGCSDGSDASSAERSSPTSTTTTALDRSATQQEVTSDWDSNIRVVVRNETTAPVEVGVTPDQHDNADKGELISPTNGAEWQPAGTTRSVVVPAASVAGGDSNVELLFQHKLTQTPRTTEVEQISEDSIREPKPINEMHEFMVQTPTLQLRFQITYAWKLTGECQREQVPTLDGVPAYVKYCTFERESTVAMETRHGSGYGAPYREIATCLNPARIVEIGSAVPDVTQRWSRLASRDFDLVTVDLESAAKIADRSCTSKDLAEVSAPGMSFAPASEPAKRLNLDRQALPEANLPGADLSWASLAGASFVGPAPANLSYTNLDHTILTGTDFADANLVGARFDGAQVDASTSLRGALLVDADLSGVTSSDGAGLPESAIDGAVLCHTKLPESLLDAHRTRTGEDLDVDAGCDTKVTEALAGYGDSGTIVNTASAVPLTLLAHEGSVDCALPSTVGSFGIIYVGTDCSGTYGSARLPTSPSGDATAEGTVEVGNAGPSRSTGGLEIATSGLPGGWPGLICGPLAVHGSGACTEVVGAGTSG